MLSFEILCVTMHQKDFSKIKEMNIHSDVVFANQADRTSYDEYEFDGHIAKMITTSTRGVGINRNISLMYSSADICLFADDDVIYEDDSAIRIVSEFEKNPDADIMIFYFETDDRTRTQKKYSKTRKTNFLYGNGWGAFRIAFRRSSMLKNNLFFTTLYGGGCVFPSGEDSMWITEARRKGLSIYVSKETIGTVSFETSTWFDGYNEKFFYGKGAYYRAVRPKSYFLWVLYVLYVYRKKEGISVKDRIKWFFKGCDGYKKLLSYSDYKKVD